MRRATSLEKGLVLAGKRARRRVVTRASRRKAKTTPAKARAKDESERSSCFVSHHACVAIATLANDGRV